MFRYAVLFFGVLAFVCGHLTEDEKEELQKLIFPMAKKCADDLGITEENFDILKKTQNPASIDPCFWACMFKGNGLIDDEGMFNKDASIALAGKFVKNDEGLERVKKIGDACLPVNEQKVSDGAKGCERAKLLAECFKENKTELNQPKI